MKSFIIALTVLIAGCASLQPQYNIKQTDFQFIIEPNSTNFITPDPKSLIDGEAQIDFQNKTCQLPSTQCRIS
jgi:PBP1b-binding outer membrane lipoprotein LpoB